MNQGNNYNGAMGDKTTDELLPLHEAMKEYDMSQPIIVSLISDENDQVGDCNDFINPLNSDHINNRKQDFVLERSNTIMNNYIKNKNTDKTPDDIDNILAVATTTRAQRTDAKRVAGNNNNNKVLLISSMDNDETSSLNYTQMDKISSKPQLIPNTNTTHQQDSSSGAAYVKLNHNEILDRTATCLRQVSKNLVNILKAYISYAEITFRVGTDYVRIKDAKMNYLNIKMYYFQMSRYMVVCELLTKLENTLFVKAFLYKTRNIAIYEENINCSVDDIESLFNEMIHWTIYGRGQDSLPDSQQISYPTENLKNVSESSLSPQLCPQSNAQTCLFTFGSPGYEIRLNVDTNILNSINNNKMTKNDHVTAQNANNSNHAVPLKQKSNFVKTVPNKTLYQHNSKIQRLKELRSNQQNLQTKQQQQQRVYQYDSRIQQQQEQRPYQQESQNKKQQMRMPYSYDSQIRQQQEQRSYEQELPIQQQQQQLPYQYSSRIEQQQEQRPHPQESHIRQQQQQQQKEQYYDSQIQQNQDKIPYQQVLQIRPQQQQNPARSISRDSGFMSPNSDQIGDVFSGELDAQGLDTPYITYVTSLNPHATHVTQGVCKVCGANASLKCVGCYQTYYCGTACQRLDWSRHKMDCTC